MLFQANAQVRCHSVFELEVLDATDQKPLSSAEIVVMETGVVATTNAVGVAQLTALCPGTYTVVIRFVGFKPQTHEIQMPGSRLRVMLEEDPQWLSEIVIEEHAPTVNASQSVAVLGSHELAKNLGKPLGELLKNLAGVNSIQTGPAIFKPVIHGVHSQRILILNNGVRQEGQQWGAEHAPEIDPFIAANIMVIKDAGALKYGTEALGGVIVVTPADLPDRSGFGGKFHLVGASNGRAGTVSGLLEGGFGTGWGWRAHGTLKRAGDFHAPNYELTNTGLQERSFSVALGKHREHAGVDVFFSHFQTTLGILRGSAISSARDLANAIGQEPPAFTQPFSYAIQTPRQEVSHRLLKLNSHWERGNQTIRIQYALQYNHRLEFDTRRGALREIPALGFRLFTHTVDVEWARQRAANRSSSWGVNGMLQDNRKVDGTQTIPFIPNYLHGAGGLFAIEKWTRGKWQLDAGVRYDWRSYRIVGFDFSNRIYRASNYFHNISGTLGAQYSFNPRQSFATTIATSWRPPNVAELYSLGTHQSAAAIEYGLLLDEQTTQVRTLSDKHAANEQAMKWVGTYTMRSVQSQFEVSAYANYILNYIYLRPTGVTESLRGVFPYFRYTQTNALFLGADGNYSFQFNSRWSARTRVSLLRASDVRADDFLIFIPPNRLELGLRYEKPTWGTWVNFYAEITPRYVMRQVRAPRVVTVAEILDAKETGVDLFAPDNRIFDFLAAPPAFFWLAGAVGISKPLKTSRLDLRLSVDNALNHSFREYTNRMRYFADEIGRNVSFSASWAF